MLAVLARLPSFLQSPTYHGTDRPENDPKMVIFGLFWGTKIDFGGSYIELASTISGHCFTLICTL